MFFFQLFINKELAANSVRPVVRRFQIQNRRACDFNVGSAENKTSLAFELGSLNFIYAEKDIVDTLGITSGKYS